MVGAAQERRAERGGRAGEAAFHAEDRRKREEGRWQCGLGQRCRAYIMRQFSMLGGSRTYYGVPNFDYMEELGLAGAG
ncbi:hypothetical protein E2562_031725 [Oryza meyeriana var. granulata]|uniref:Uncharacterized protein n=1 Tax=Oryza meyeriana var. granulata TaxID=110450 RepID=A0A6G1FEP3_9ORYZ|nr:hypothetical protein E2562_031725 [Oryza meyeriana var. granulata]